MRSTSAPAFGVIVIAALPIVSVISQLNAQEPSASRGSIGIGERRLSELEDSVARETTLTRLRQEGKVNARKRAAQDKRHYKPDELAEVERLYQVANKKWRSDEARDSLKRLLEKYDSANRTGCALLYMGQMSEGKDRVAYLTRAVEEFSDCYYYDGCQVGGYGRYVLALTLWESGEKDQARLLFSELKKEYKDAIDHRGRPMSELAAAAENELGAK